MGLEAIGIPGAGEPLLPKNVRLTLRILEKCQDLGLYVTLFTTGEFITGNLADRLNELPVELMIKCNSLDPIVQDAFVSDPSRGRIIHGYGQKRNETLELLMKKGFNDEERCMAQYGRKSRMAIVTSIMTSSGGGPSNYDEMAHILKFARQNNIMVDIDSVLKVGRGATCDLCEEDQRLKAKLIELQGIDRNEFGNVWQVGQSYIGTVCDRHSYHMFIDQYGRIRPCVGAVGVDLGNIRTTSLQEAWDSREMRIIRARNYKGKCSQCANFNEIDEIRTKEAGTVKYKCNSCLGRRTEDLTNAYLLGNGHVKTIGCWNHRPM